MNLRILGGAVGLAAVLATGVAVTSAAPVDAQAAPQIVAQNYMRGEVGSARNLLSVRRRLEALIDQMQHDQRDYGGYRVQAIQALQQARQDIIQAIQYDSSHRH